ncbi:DUF3159 domain-containing protein [Spongisporangium articulatum]|uniref:DUF3159 domain-containing protein n=1 Tax=Spongisporangium articulatum TaxID=3362603 RepID=A0ABW8ATM4_9ACTN
MAAEATRGGGGPAAPQGGVGQLGAEHFDLGKSVGGPRGLIESVLPYAVFSIVYGVTRDLRPAIYAAVVPVVVLAVWRLVRRESLMQAVSGVIGVLIGAYAAQRTGNAANFFVPTIIKNIGFALVYAVSALVRWPLLGLVVGSMMSATGMQEKLKQEKERPAGSEGADEPEPSLGEMFADMVTWRKDPALLTAYTWATWVWVGMFAVRLAVQVPLYLADQVTLLGLLNGLVLGVPLFALTLYLSWLILRGPLRGD